MLIRALLEPLQAYLGGLLELLVLVSLGEGQSYIGVLVAASIFGVVTQSNLEAFDGDDESPTTSAAADGSTNSRTPSEEESASGVIYARVSSQNQVENGSGLDEQIRNLSTIANKQDINVVRTLRDEGETGQNFEREGIQAVRRLAEDDSVEYVLVDAVDRIGRHAAETIFYLYELREECEVTVITTEEGELDINTFSGLTNIIMRSLSSQMENDRRTRRAHNARVEEFRQKNWSVFHKGPPVGYTLTDEDWLEIDKSEAPIVQEMFTTFLEASEKSAYRSTTKRVDYFDDEADASVGKRRLQNRVYIGEPTIATTSTDLADKQAETTVVDKALQIIDEETFKRAQEKIQRIHKRYATGSDKTDDIEDLVERFGIDTVVDSSPEVRLHCPDCRSEMVKNGQRTLSDRKVHNYKCTECGRQRRFPTERELDGMKETNNP